MVFSVVYTIYGGFKLDAQRSQGVMSTNCQYGIVLNMVNFLKWKFIYVLTFSVVQWDTWDGTSAF